MPAYMTVRSACVTEALVNHLLECGEGVDHG